ncbi:unnamed protein product [Phyllotreta striolata]|uniref:ACB domain-containing protein n=1 Tax=Phyllotreta striolata TaxID=444603 RepID=A0A9N9TN56_PHYSR|nr:unnamed protein product [Phyllotreta striolata]
MTTEQKFKAAVNVIRSLPKNGSYQPSHELMLRFYAYFKQATNGPCQGSRPAFWDVVGRAKYDAWKKLGDMSSQEAMAKYVDELHSIVETMSYSDKVANFLEAPTDELECINFDDLELVAGDVLERVRSQPNSPLASREGSPNIFSKNSSLRSSSNVSSVTESDHSDDEYIDTIENPDPRRNVSISADGSASHSVQNHISKSKNPNIDVSQEINRAVQSLRGDIERLSKKVVSLENSSSAVKMQRRGLFDGVPTRLVVFLVVWPFIAQFITNRFLNRRR